MLEIEILSNVVYENLGGDPFLFKSIDKLAVFSIVQQDFKKFI